MSMYTQSNMYGQPSYGSPSFPPPVNNGYQYHYPSHPPAPPIVPPTHVFQVDPNTFRRDYTKSLSELHFNSRPIIQNLSMLAQDYSRYAEIVVQCVEAHIRRVPVWMKLPAFYLLDAISKNVYEPYARHFASIVTPLFLETYGQVDEPTRNKMEEMLLTWRTGSPTGKELFGTLTQIAIERGVWGDGGGISLTDGFYTGSGQITKAQVLSELQFTLGQKERAAQANPYDTVSQNHVTVLHQLRRLVETGVSQNELRQILSQLRNLVRTAPSPPLPQSLPPASTHWQQPPYPTVNHSPAQPPPRLYHVDSTMYPPSTFVKAEPASSASVPSSSATSSALPAPENLTNLLTTLLKAGVVSANGTPLGAGATIKDAAMSFSSLESVDSNREASREYRKAILSHKVKLTSSDILRSQPRVVDLLYERLGSKCKQCGLRFSDNAQGKKSMEEHLDMHFRQNRKATQNVGRGHSRSWFVGIEDWIHDVSGNDKGKGRADGSPQTSKANIAKREADLRAHFVVVPPGDEAKFVSCPICKETLKSEFLEEDEDWVWKNAVLKDEKIYHATCHAEALSSTSSLAARLRNELAGASRGGTPELSSGLGSNSISRSTPPPSGLGLSKSPSPDSSLFGTKRKIEHRDSDVSEEVTGTPPFKKIALSTTGS